MISTDYMSGNDNFILWHTQKKKEILVKTTNLDLVSILFVYFLAGKKKVMWSKSKPLIGWESQVKGTLQEEGQNIKWYYPEGDIM